MLKDQETMDQHFVTQKVGVEDKGSGDTTNNVQTLMEAFLNMSLRPSCFIVPFFKW
jgi:hypothetical protein